MESLPRETLANFNVLTQIGITMGIITWFWIHYILKCCDLLLFKKGQDCGQAIKIVSFGVKIVLLCCPLEVVTTYIPISHKKEDNRLFGMKSELLLLHLTLFVTLLKYHRVRESIKCHHNRPKKHLACWWNKAKGVSQSPMLQLEFIEEPNFTKHTQENRR